MYKLKYVVGTLLLVGIDQISKIYAQNHFLEEMKVFDFFRLKLTYNSGIAFSIPISQGIVIFLTVVILAGLGYQLFFKKLSLVENIALLLVFGGAIGNLVDRILVGTVTDFLAFWSFPIFNLADTFITVGIVLFLWDEVFGNKKNHPKG